MEDLDLSRCRREYVDGAMEDLRWLGIAWDGGVVFQSARRERYLEAWRRLRDGRWIYPCRRSRRDVATAAVAPHGEEPVFPVEWRSDPEESALFDSPAGVNWRFRVPDGERMEFVDGNVGAFERVALRDFGDFIVWNRDDIPAYELAVVVDDIEAGVTEVVRGVDLLTSTARQALIYRALSAPMPRTFHMPLVVDGSGRRLAKRSGGWSVRELREKRMSPADVIEFATRHVRDGIKKHRGP